jgi:DNA polymerase II small subunit/DNA polymerase delta subunit B
LSLATRTLEWRHIAPTAPDTLCELSLSFVGIDEL